MSEDFKELSNHPDQSLIPLYYDAKLLGESLNQIEVDFQFLESQQMQSRWFKGSRDVDFVIWSSHDKVILKQQLSILGHIVEWNILEGTKTGMLIEEEVDAQDEAASQFTRYDITPSRLLIQQAVDLITHMQNLQPEEKKIIQNNWVTSRTEPSHPFAHRSGKLQRRAQHSSRSLWFGRLLKLLKSLLARLR